MANKLKKVAVFAVAAVLGATVVGAAACADENQFEVVPGGVMLEGNQTYRTYTSVMPSNWNELTYEDNNDTQILNYLTSSFYEFDYQFEDGKKYNADGSVNYDGIIADGYTVNYSAATALEDVTEEMAADWGYTEKQIATGGYAWKITLREDLKWDDGTPIDASDFEYSMKEMLNPDFQNMRASTYYNMIQVRNARNYLYQGQSGWFAAADPYDDFAALVAEQGDKVFFSLASPEENTANFGSAVCNFRTAFGVPAEWTAKQIATYLVETGVNCKADATVDEILALEGKSYNQIIADANLKKTWEAVLATWKTVDNEELDFFLVDYTYPELSYDEVGVQAVSQYEIVICLDAPIQCLDEEGNLRYEAAYSLQSLPLVKEDLYEQCKQQPATGSNLWTTNYNTSVETTASWGPYKLTQFQSGTSYTLSRNDNWYGYGDELYKNQYNVKDIYCMRIEDVNTQWMAFLGGMIDSIGLDPDHKDQYRNSAYTYFTPGTGSFGINIYANLEVLKTNGRNNGILAITEFREALSLGLDRDEYNTETSTSHQTCLGIMGPSYYYDIENSATLEDHGVYRESKYAKEGILRAYGYTENGDGTWSFGTTKYDDYEAAYAACKGYSPAAAKELIEEAYKILTENAAEYGYDSSKQITLLYGTAADNANTRRAYEYVRDYITDLVKGTSLEGKITVNFDASFGSGWADDFKSGAYDIADGTGFGGGAFDPASFLQCYLDPNAGLMYSTWWDTEKEMLTYTMPEGDYEGAGEELTMSLYNWYCCLNGIAEANEQPNLYNWGAGFVSEEVRLQLLAKLEEVVISKYYTIFTTSQYSATVNGAKWSYASEDYNVFLGYGGYRYMILNYGDKEFTEFVHSQGDNLESLYQRSR